MSITIFTIAAELGSEIAALTKTRSILSVDSGRRVR